LEGVAQHKQKTPLGKKNPLQTRGENKPQKPREGLKKKTKDVHKGPNWKGGNKPKVKEWKKN